MNNLRMKPLCPLCSLCRQNWFHDSRISAFCCALIVLYRSSREPSLFPRLLLDAPSSILRPMVWAPASAFLSKLVLPGFFSSCTSDIERFGAGGADAATTHLGEVGPDAPDSFDDELRCRVTLRSDENVLSESASAVMPRSIAYISTRSLA